MRDIAASALTPPALPRGFVSRPALRAVLDGAADRALTLVSAPPGFGKSLLLADWVARSPQVPAAWVSLDDECTDPRRFWNTVLAALDRCPGVPEQSRLHRLIVSRTTVELDFLDDLLRALASLPQRIRLVLDDAHHLRAGPVVDQLRLLVRAHGPRVHLVLAARIDPPLPLARLRLDDELCEVRVDRLRFARAEAEALVRRSGLSLDPRQSALLHERTGGWVAGLTLAARSLAGHPDPDGFLADFSGDERSVADYLVDEVLAGIGEDQREVLRRTSVVDPVPAGLAVELCDREDAAEVLDELSRELGLVVRSATGRADYSVQELLRSYLLADVQRQGSALVADLHRRAAVWWDRDGRPAQALRHAAHSGDPAFVAGLLRRRAPELVGRGDHAVLRCVVDAVDDVPDADTWRAALSALEHLERGDRAAVAAELRRVRRDGGITDEGLAALLRATGRLAGLDTRVADGEPVPPDPALAALVRAGRGTARVVTGAPDAAHDDLVAALDDARRLGLPLLEVHCLCGLASAAWLTGDLHEASTAAAAVAAHGRCATGWAVAAQVVVALTALEQARPHAALAAADAGLGQSPARLDPEVRFGLRVARGGALFDIGEGAAGLLELQQARAQLGEHPVHCALTVTAALSEQRIALRLGYVRAASAAAGRISGRIEARPERLLMRAWTQLAAGAHRDAHATVAPLLEPSSRPVRPTTAVEARLVAVRALLEDGDRPAARQVLRAALDQALPLGAVRPFTLAPSAVRALLVDELVAGDERGRFAALVVAASHAGGRSAAAVLTSREHDVLVRLPSLLNLDEIAVDMAVSVNTVKSHVRSIYDKLGVGTRRRAVLVAHEQGLLREPAADHGAATGT